MEGLYLVCLYLVIALACKPAIVVRGHALTNLQFGLHKHSFLYVATVDMIKLYTFNLSDAAPYSLRL